MAYCRVRKSVVQGQPLRRMGLLSALKLSSGKSEKKSISKVMPKGRSQIESEDPTPLKPLKLSLTPVADRTRPSSAIVRSTSDDLASRDNSPVVRTNAAVRRKPTILSFVNFTTGLPVLQGVDSVCLQ